MISAKEPANQCIGVSYHHIGLLALCYLKELIYNKEVKFRTYISPMLTELYKEMLVYYPKYT